jgi:hypothetical protein
MWVQCNIMYVQHIIKHRDKIQNSIKVKYGIHNSVFLQSSQSVPIEFLQSSQSIPKVHRSVPIKVPEAFP